MTVTEVLPLVGYLAAAVAILGVALGARASRAVGWRVPAVLAAAFWAFSVATISCEGLLAFWTNHTTNLAGNQVWFDLLIAVAIAFWLMAPRARAVGMPLLPWAIAVLATASLALLPMLARLIWLERSAGRGGAAR